MSPRKSPSKQAAARSAPPHDFYGKRRADAVKSSRMGELRSEEAQKMGMGDVRKEEYDMAVEKAYAKVRAKNKLKFARARGEGKQT